jgi:hypothetical protein
VNIRQQEAIGTDQKPCRVALAKSGTVAEDFLRFHSEKGFRLSERVLTVTQSLKLQRKAVFQFLCDAITALRKGKPAPSLT